MRDELQKANSARGQTRGNECLVINTDHSSNTGTHWTCLCIKEGVSYYFDSYGFPPPLEVLEYCKGQNRYYSSFKIQMSNEVICGHYCIYMLYKLSTGFSFYEILDELYRYNN